MQFEFLDVNRREDVELHQALGEHDGVFEVVAVPGHERHRDVRAKRELPHFRGGTVGQHFTLGHRLPHAHERALVDGGVLVGAPVLLQLVAVEMAESGQRAIGIHHTDHAGIDDDLVGRHAGDGARTTRDDHRARVDGDRRFEAGANERRARVQERHGLTLHVRAHQRAVGVVVLEERNERGGDRHELFRRHVHVVDVGRRREREVSTLTRQHEIVDERAVGIELGIGLRDDGVFFAVGVEPDDFTGDPAVLHHAVRGLDEAEIVHAGVAGERRDQADVRAFRRLDGAHATVLRVVHVSHFEAGTLTREAARSEGRQTTLVRQFGERIGLVHELRELRRTEERLNDGGYGTRIHEIVERDLLGIGVDRHALLDQSRHARETNGELVGDQLTHRADTAVAQLIDIVHIAAAFVEFHELAHDLDEVFLREDGGRHRRVETQTLVDLVATDPTEVVALGREEQALERLLGRLAVGRVARTEERVDLLERFLLVLRRVLGQGVLDQRRLGTAGGDEHLHLGQVGLADALDDGINEDGALFGHDLTGVGIDDVARQRAAHFALAAVDRVLFVAQVDLRVRGEDLDLIEALPHEAVEHLFGQFVSFTYEELGLGPFALGFRFLRFGLRRIIGGDFTFEGDVFGNDGAQELTEFSTRLTLHGEIEFALGEEQAQDVPVLSVAERAQERRGRELLFLIDVDVDHIVDVHGELDPRSPEGNDARREEALPVRVRALLEHDAWRAVQL